MNISRVLQLLALLGLLAGCDATAPEPIKYRHPMRPDIYSPVPMQDEMGMDYIPVYAEAAQDTSVMLSPQMVNNLGVRTAAVSHGAAGATLRVPGITAWDERGRVEVRVRTEGYVERLAVRATGERVRAGQLLFAVYSPMLAAAQGEWLAARRLGDAALLSAASTRLQALGLSEAAVQRLREGGEPEARVNYYAPRAGVVLELGIRDGGLAEPGMSALVLVPTDQLWVVAEVPEALAAGLRPGLPATVSFAALPGERFEAEVLELLPELSPGTRSVQARIRMANPGGVIAAGMVADVELAIAAPAHALWVPAGALIRTGSSERVIVALGEGRFAAREVVAGREFGEQVEIRSGLDGSEQVVVSGQFMIDSESQLRSSLARYGDEAAPAEHEHHRDHGGGP